eukprot:gene15058-17798_t
MPNLTGFGDERILEEESTLSVLPKPAQYVSSNATHFRFLKDCSSVERRQFVMPSPDYRSSTECGTAQTLEEKRGVSTELKPEPPRTKRGVLRPRGSLCPEKRRGTPDSEDSDSSDTAADTALERETAASVRTTAEFKKPVLGSVGLGQKDWRVAFPPSEVELSGNPGTSVPNSPRVPKHAHPELAMNISHIDIAGRAGAGPAGSVKLQEESELTVRESAHFKEKLWPQAGCAPGASRQTLLDTTLRNPPKTLATQGAAWGQASGLTLRLIPSAMSSSAPVDEDSVTPPLCGMSLQQIRTAQSHGSVSSQGSITARSLSQESQSAAPSRAKAAHACSSRVSINKLERTEQLNQLLNASMLSSHPRPATPNWLKGAHFPDFTGSVPRGGSTRRGQEMVYATMHSVGSD